MKAEVFPKSEDQKYRKIYGGLAWPGKRPGFIVIIGELRQPGMVKYVLLDEKEDFDTREIVTMAGALDFYYRPEKWLSDISNPAAMKFVQEFNCEFDPRTGSRRLKLLPSRLLGLKEGIFSYVFPRLKRMVGEGGSLDISRGAKLLGYMGTPQEAEISEIVFGDFPSIESLAFAVFELDQIRNMQPRQTHAVSEYKPF